ncbi:MAG: GBS Bsp-like repeat-containing protein [Lachnospiraceae bacterium]|nr:GBS Bsp-like repeat-containing protein [Lachnospiraceae bacterium]
MKHRVIALLLAGFVAVGGTVLPAVPAAAFTCEETADPCAESGIPETADTENKMPETADRNSENTVPEETADTGTKDEIWEEDGNSGVPDEDTEALPAGEDSDLPDSGQLETDQLETDPQEPGYLEQEISWSVTPEGRIQIRYQEMAMYPELRFAVWSGENGQDDLIWLKARSENGKVFTAEFDPGQLKHLGRVYIHAYSGSLFLMQKIVETGSPSVGSIAVEDLNEETGTCSVVLSDLEHPELIREIQIPVWSDPKQRDIVWYKAERLTGNTAEEIRYRLKLDIASHKYNLGTYIAHVYLRDLSGKQSYQGGTRASFSVQGTLEAAQMPQSVLLQAQVKDLVVPGGWKELRFAVWSAENGQDDLRWFTTGKTSAEFDLNDFRHQGLFYIHLYAVTKSGNLVFAGNTTCNAELEPVTIQLGDMTAEEIQPVLVKNLLQSTFREVRAAVWSAKNGQDDLVWYTGIRQSDGTIRIPVNMKNHRDEGAYYVHVYGVTSQGKMQFIGQPDQKLELPSVMIRKDRGDGKRTVVIRNASAKAVSVPVWSQYNGQDDLVWYTASKIGEGVWQAVIDVSRHRNAGRYLVHIYADNTFAGNTEFTLPYSEVKTEYTELAANLKAAESTQQLILTCASGTSARTVMLNKNEDGTWFQLLSSSGYVGSAGVGDTTEWNRKTPRGTYGFTMAFGIRPDPGTAFDYVQVNSSHYWVDDVNSKYYNQFVSTKNTVKDWNSAEHLIDYTGSYGYCLALDYNPQCTPGVGSAIFLHCSSGRPTAGCISVPESVMKKILNLVRRDCLMVIDTAEGGFAGF